MAVNETGAIYKAMTIDGESSRTYGVYITGQAVYNAPAREVEMISVPGRNGQLAIDKGRFENIEVTYPAGIYADTEEDFAEAVSNFRNFLCSRDGYVRIEDEYNPNEYRMGIYKSGLEVETAGHKAGEFEIIFDCKPQRWLTDGETAVTVDSGDVISNPTLFEASPLLEIEGYGAIDFNGYEITIADDLVGDVKIATNVQIWGKANYYIYFPDIYINTGDAIDVGTVNTPVLTVGITDVNGYGITDVLIQNASGYSQILPSITYDGTPISTLLVPLTPTMTLFYGTELTNKESFDLTITNSNGDTKTYNIEFGVEYDGNKTLRFFNSGLPRDGYFSIGLSDPYLFLNGVVIHSTATTFGHPTFIDCDFGEAYADDNGVISSLNLYIDLGSDLPTLAPGANTITFDNTITDLKVVPRWWKV